MLSIRRGNSCEFGRLYRPYTASLAVGLLVFSLLLRMFFYFNCTIYFSYQRCVSIMNCFAGGVFMGTALLDLLPQVTLLMKLVIEYCVFSTFD